MRLFEHDGFKLFIAVVLLVGQASISWFDVPGWAWVAWWAWLLLI